MAAARDRLAATRGRSMRGHEGALAARWEHLLEGPMEDLVGVLVGLDPESILLRSSTPFVGIVSSEERARALELSRGR